MSELKTYIELQQNISASEITFGETETKKMVFNLLSMIQVFSKKANQNWEDAERVFYGCYSHTAFTRYKSLP